MEDKKFEACDFNSMQLQDLQNLLGDFEEIFVLPTKLPLYTEHDHHITLVQDAKPPNIRPYYYGPL